MDDELNAADDKRDCLSPDGVNVLEDLQVGACYDFGTATVTKEAIIDFARKFDPQPFHLDEVAARDSMFGGLVASGFHTLSMIHNAAVTQGFLARAGKAGIGFDKVRLYLPVRPGDILHVIAEVVSVRPSSRRPDQGYARLRYQVSNQDGKTVVTLVTDGVFHRR